MSRGRRGTAVRVKYVDDCYDYMRLSLCNHEIMIAKNGSGRTRTDTVFLEDTIFKVDCSVAEHLDIIHLNDLGNNETESGNKRFIFHETEATLLRDLGLFSKIDSLQKPADAVAIAETVGVITEQKLDISGDKLTISAVCFALEQQLGIKLLKHTSYREQWFDERMPVMQSMGLYEIEYNSPEQTFYFDDLAGMCFDLLFANNGDEPYLIQVAQRIGVERLLNTYERRFVYFYYQYRDPEIRESTRQALPSGCQVKTISLLGGSINHAYYNEWTTADNIHYALCIGFDPIVQRTGRGLLALYNRETGKAKLLDNRFVRAYCHLVSADNKVYYTVHDQIWRYDIQSETKTCIYKQPEGHYFQEIPTITEDGKFLSVFWGSRISYWPDHAGVLNLETGLMKVLVDVEWVKAHFDGQVNPFIGHVIINPQNPNIINFLHGGGINVDDRMWLADGESGRIWEPYKQVYTEDGEFGEALTHWFWSNDGKRLYFVRIKECAISTPSGIAYIDITKPKQGAKTLNGDFPYIHVGISRNDLFFAGDTYIVLDEGKFRSEIYFYDSTTNQAVLLDQIPIMGRHPGHPHPSFSADGSHFIYAYSDETGKIVKIGMIDTKEALCYVKSKSKNKLPCS